MRVIKNIFLILIFFEFSKANIFSQELTANETQLDSLYALKSKLEASLDSVNTKIDELEAIINGSQIKIDTTRTVQVILTTDCNMRDKPSAFSDIIKFLPKNTEMLVIEYESGYFSVKVGNEIGYVNEMFFPKDKSLNRISSHGKSGKSNNLEKNKTSTTSQKLYNPSKTLDSDNKIIHTGPRGGKYYINSEGKKVYIDKEKKK
jgi:hypothetical protein